MASKKRYIVLANCNQNAIVGMVQAPTDQAAAVKKICKAMEVKFLSMNLYRGALDIVVLAESARRPTSIRTSRCLLPQPSSPCPTPTRSSI